MPVILTTSPPSLPGLISISNSGVLLSGIINEIDLLDVNDVNTIKWIIELMDTTNEKILSFEILAINKFNTSIGYNKYAIIGDKIDHILDISINSGFISLTIINNEIPDVTYKVMRIQLN